MASYILKRLLLMIPTLLGVLIITFGVIQFVPGGPVEQMVAQLQGRDSGGERAASSGAGYRGRQGLDPQRIEEIKKLYGFDKPAHERLWTMLKSFARFDLGTSFYQRKDVWELVKEKMPVSISLGLWTFFISYLIAVPLGVAKAVRAGSRFDFLTTLIVLIGYAIPGFVLGVALLVIFGGQLQWFPLRGLTSPNWESLSWGARIVDYLWHIALPVTAMVIGSFAVTAMLTKNRASNCCQLLTHGIGPLSGKAEKIFGREEAKRVSVPCIYGDAAERAIKCGTNRDKPCSK